MACAKELAGKAGAFETWLVDRAYASLCTISRLGLVVAALFLMVVDPLLLYWDAWGSAVPLSQLVAWHAVACLYFGTVLHVGAKARPPASQQRVLQAFVVGTTLLFIWFGVVSWLGTRDLSMVAVAQVLLASVLCLPGTLRRWSYGLQALAISTLLIRLDPSGEFLGHMQFANVLAAAAVAYVMDRYMLDHAGALFAQQCRATEEQQRADAVLYNTLPPAIAQELKAHKRVQAQSYPAMAILFADLVGFTEFAVQRTPDQVLDLLNQLFSELDALIDLHQVEKIKTMGDAYLVISKHRPEPLAHLALAMGRALERFNQEQGLQLSLRLGMHCGAAIAGVIGHRRFMYDVWGDAVNLASRMQSSSKPGHIHTSEALFLRLRGEFKFEARGLVEIKGRGALPTYFLLDAEPGAAVVQGA